MEIRGTFSLDAFIYRWLGVILLHMLITDEDDLVVDPFAGSNVTGEVCECLKRRWIAVDIVEEYLEGSKFRFDKFCIGDWLETSGQRSFMLREGSKK